MLGSRGKGLCGRVEGGLVLTLFGGLAVLPNRFPKQGKHKAPSTATHPPLTPTVSDHLPRYWITPALQQKHLLSYKPSFDHASDGSRTNPLGMTGANYSGSTLVNDFVSTNDARWRPYPVVCAIE